MIGAFTQLIAEILQLCSCLWSGLGHCTVDRVSGTVRRHCTFAAMPILSVAPSMDIRQEGRGSARPKQGLLLRIQVDVQLPVGSCGLA